MFCLCFENLGVSYPVFSIGVLYLMLVCFVGVLEAQVYLGAMFCFGVACPKHFGVSNFILLCKYEFLIMIFPTYRFFFGLKSLS